MDRYIADELCGFTFTVNGFQTLFELIRRLQKQENLEKVPQNLPILMVSGAEDRWEITVRVSGRHVIL